MTLTLTTITREEALDLLLRGTQTKRAEIEAHIRDLRSQLDFDGTPSRNDAARAEAMHRRYQPGASEGQLRNAATQPLMETMLSRRIIPTKPRHKRSAATRKRMSEAQQARWAKRKAV